MPASHPLSRRATLLGLALAGMSPLVGRTLAADGREVVHTLGTATISGKPQRVLVISDFTDLEYTLALGARPVAYGATGAWARGGLPWQQLDTPLETFDMSAQEVKPEIVASYAPDLIIGMATYLEPVLPQLQQLAPVVALDWSMPWRDGLRIVAAALDEAALAETRITGTEALIARTAERLKPLAGRKVMIGSNYGGTLYVIGEGPIATLFRGLGLDFVAARGDAELVEYSLENVDVLAEAEILLSLASDAEGTATLEALPTFRRLPAVAARAYAPVDSVLSSGFVDNFSPLSAPWALPRLAELLTGLAAGQGKALG